MKKVISIISCAIISLALIGCGSNKKTYEYPANYEKMSQFIGKTTEMVVDELKLTEDNMVLYGLYDISEEVEFWGQKYQTYLGTGEKVTSVQYKLSFENDMKAAASAVAELKSNLLNTYGEADKGIVNGLVDQTDFEKALSKEKTYSNYWNLFEECPDNIKEYINALKESTGQDVYYKLYVSVYSDGKSLVIIDMCYKVIVGKANSL